MYKTLSITVPTKLNCCIGDTVSMNVRAVEKLTSYGSATKESGVPAIILGAGLDSKGQFTYVLQYDACVLRDLCNYLIPNDVDSLCCVNACGCAPSPCKSECTPPPPPKCGCQYIKAC